MEFAQISTDCAQIFSFFSRIFDKSKRLGLRLYPGTPASYTTVFVFFERRSEKTDVKLIKT